MLHLKPGGPFFVDADLEHRDISQIAQRAVDLMNTFRPHAFVIETNQFQELLAGEIARLSKPLNLTTEIFHCVNSLAKVVRIRSLTAHLAKGRLRFKRNSRGAKLLVQQLRDFPHDDHDDGPDALEMALRVLHECLTARRRREDFTVEHIWP
jgi:predicted phage terminase large subunit-like protein